MADTDIASPYAEGDEREVEAALRPRRLEDFVGQPKVREQLGLVLTSALRRGRPPDHILLSGAPGLGKTSLAMIVAVELGSRHPRHQRPGDRAGRRPGRDPHRAQRRRRAVRGRDPPDRPAGRGDPLHRDGGLPRRRRGGQGPGRDRDPARGRAVHAGRRHDPGRACSPGRCGTGSASSGTWTSTSRPSWSRCCVRSAGLLGVRLEPDAADEIAGRSRGTPRIANRLLRRVRDYAEVRADGVLTRAVAQAALRVYDVDDLGLDRLDRAVLDALVRRFGGGPVGVSTLAVAVGEEQRDGRGGGRAVPGPGRAAGPDAPGPGRDPGRLDAPRPDPAGTPGGIVRMSVGRASRGARNRHRP